MDAPAIEMADPLAEALGALPPGGRFRYTYDDAVKMCGHSCPTVAGAWLMTASALAALYPGGVPVRGEVEVVVGGMRDDGAAGPMAQVIGLVTGAAPETGFGGLMGRWRRRDLLRFDQALAGRVRFRRADTGAAVDLSYAPDRVPHPQGLGDLLARVLSGGASQDERARFATLWQGRVAAILADPGLVVEVRPAG